MVDTSAVVSGPLATRILADRGAEVIKVEVPGQGDVLRYVGSSRGGMTASFHLVNRGKRSIALNLAEQSGVSILRKPAAKAVSFRCVSPPIRPAIRGPHRSRPRP